MRKIAILTLVWLFAISLILGSQNGFASTYPQIIGVSRAPLNPTPDSLVNVTFCVVDNYGLVNASLHYSINDSTVYREISARIIDGDFQNGTFVGQIPKQPENTRVEYFVFAQDAIGYSSQSDKYSFEVAVDKTPPQIIDVKRISPVGSPVFPSENVTIEATVADDGSGVKTVTLCYGIGEDPFNMRYNEIPMQRNGTDRYRGSIPALPIGTNVYYFVKASDNADNSGEDNSRTPYYVNTPTNSNLQIIVEVKEIDTKNMTARAKITVQGQLPSIDNEPFNVELECGQLYTMQINFSSTDTLRGWCQSSNEYTFYLSGNPSLYPFDSYVLNMTFRIFWSQPNSLTINTFVTQPVFGNTWNGHYQYYNKTDSFGLPLMVDTVNIERNVYGDVFPQILLVIMLFFVLGGTLLVEPTKLNERLTIFLGIFVFVAGFYFSLGAIIPVRIGFTLSERLFLSLVSGSALFAVGSLLASTMAIHLRGFHVYSGKRAYIVAHLSFIFDLMSVLILFWIWLFPVVTLIPLFFSALIVLAVSYGLVLRTFLNRAHSMLVRQEEEIV